MDLTSQVVAITMICYGIGIVWSVIFRKKDDFNAYIPAVVSIAGAILGVLGFYLMPDYPADNILTAIAVGVMSGLASTGADQLIKQMAKKSENKDDEVK